MPWVAAATAALSKLCALFCRAKGAEQRLTILLVCETGCADLAKRWADVTVLAFGLATVVVLLGLVTGLKVVLVVALLACLVRPGLAAPNWVSSALAGLVLAVSEREVAAFSFCRACA